MPFAVTGECPSDAESLFAVRLAPATSNADYRGGFARYNIRLAADRLWLNDDLCIPLASIRSRVLLKKGLLIPRHALQIVFLNPVTNANDVSYLCDVTMLGFYRRASLQRLNDALGVAIGRLPEAERPPTAQDAAPPRSTSLPTALFDSIRTLIASSESLETKLCLQWMRSLAPDKAIPDVPLSEARPRLELLLETRCLDVDTDAVLARNRRALRVCAAWTLFWSLLMPCVLLAIWLIPRPPERWDAGHIVAAILVISVGYIVLAVACTFCGAVLLKPFIWVANKAFGLDIKLLKSREY